MLGEQGCEYLHSGVDGLCEALLLAFDNTGDIVLLLTQLGILALIFMDNGVDDFIKERLVHAKELSVTGSSSEQTAQHIAAPLVRGQDTVAYHKCSAADMVGDNAQ